VLRNLVRFTHAYAHARAWHYAQAAHGTPALVRGVRCNTSRTDRTCALSFVMSHHISTTCILCCISLSSDLKSIQIIYHFGRLDDTFTVVSSNLVFDTICDDVLFVPVVPLLSTISFHAYFYVSCNKRLKYMNLWNFSAISPITSMDAYIPWIYVGIDGIKVVPNYHQHMGLNKT
jgi:hypothetical protein